MTRIALAAALLLLLTAAACSDASSPPAPKPSAQPTTTATTSGVRASAAPRVTASPNAIPQGAVTPVSSTQPPTPTPTPPPRTRPPTGNATADAAIAAIAAIEERDVDGLLALMTFEPQPCVAIQQVGTNAECPPGIAPGTPVEQFALTHCEGGGLLPAEARGALVRWLEGVESVYGAYRMTSNPNGWWWGRAGVVVLVRAGLPNGTYSGRSLFLTEPAAGAAWLHSGCTGDVEESAAFLAGYGALQPLGEIVH